MNLRGRDLISIDDYSPEEAAFVLATAASLKKNPGQVSHLADGMTLAMIFEKQSLRTRVTFEAGMTQMGGHGIYLQPSDIGLGKREPVKDVARNISRWCQAIMARTFAHQTVIDLAEYANIPVINALSDWEHPCQALADFLTLQEHKGQLKGLTMTYVGDGNNVAHSLMLLAAKMGTNFNVACPEGYEPAAEVVTRARDIAATTGATITVGHDPIALVEGADAVYTDVWTSMGQEEEKAERLQIFPPYQLNSALMSHAKADALVMHCLPAHRGEEITDEVFESPQSVVFDEAENRLHAQKAVLALSLGYTPAK
ncbi:MAG TPA: ornithine carbamoyltransferase [Armatimonadota bacterium]|nr:ornithine carbamoyltransferase [Armatimonadota bacterium]